MRRTWDFFPPMITVFLPPPKQSPGCCKSCWPLLISQRQNSTVFLFYLSSMPPRLWAFSFTPNGRSFSCIDGSGLLLSVFHHAATASVHFSRSVDFPTNSAGPPYDYAAGADSSSRSLSVRIVERIHQNSSLFRDRHSSPRERTPFPLAMVGTSRRFGRAFS